MKEKSIYKSSELPDHTLEDFENVKLAFLELICTLCEKYHMTAIIAGMSKAQLEIFLMAEPNKIKKVLLNQADYFLTAAEKLEDE